MLRHCGSAVALLAACCFVVSGLCADDGSVPASSEPEVRIELLVTAAKLSGPGVKINAESSLAMHWTDPADRADWTFTVPRAGVYDLLMRWQVEETQSGQPFVIEVDGENAIMGEVPTTFGRSAPEERPFGQLELAAGEHRLALHPAMKVEGDLFELRSFTLVPGGGRKSAPPMTVAEGFEIEQIAGPPLVKHPMMACFDDRGRMFISESSGINRQAAELLKTKPHSILMLEDLDSDGRFDRSTVFADQLVEPNGALWHNGALYVCSSPFLWRFEDTDGDGTADKRDRVLGRFDFSGMHDAFHGPTLGPDGRLYFCGGQRGWVLCAPDADTPIASRVPGVFSCWPDGSDPEDLGHGGTANPVEVTFTPEGEVLGTLAILDGVDGRHDALLHWIYGGIYNIREEYRDKVRVTGELLAAFGRRGHVAPAGIMRYRGGAFGPEYRDNVFLCEFNTHKVFRVMLERDGATFRRSEEVFLSSPDNDVHFTDVFEDADGSLVVLDTGGWFRYGCPTSQVAKSHILGGIYRIRKSGAETAVEDPRGLAVDWTAATNSALCGLLDDARFPVRDRAMAVLAVRGDAAVAELESSLRSASEEVRRNAIWTLTRIETDAARSAVRKALLDESASVRLTATRSCSTRRDAAAAARLVELLADTDPSIRREAATALGRIASRAAVPALIAALKEPTDRFLEHSLIYALIQIGDRDATLAGLTAPAPQVRRAALIALDQMPGGNLSRDDISKLLDTDDPALQRTVLEMLGRRPGWTDEIAELAGRWITEPKLDADRQASLRGVLVAYGKDPKIQKLMADALRDPNAPLDTHLLVLDAMARSDANPLPEPWRAPLVDAFNASEPRLLSQAVTAASALAAAEFHEAFVRVGRDAAHPIGLRIAAVAAAASVPMPLEGELFDLAAAECAASDDPILRLAAARALGGAVLDEGQRSRLIELLAMAGPLELPSLIAPFDTPAGANEGIALVAALAKAPAADSLTLARVDALLNRYPPEVRGAASSLVDRLRAAALEQQSRLASLESVVREGDAAHGRELFFGARASCAACHQVQRQGGQVGPDLSHIGEIRSRRDLLEAIAFPSASFARGFEPVNIVTQAGKVHSGIISRETPTAVFLRTAERAEIRVDRDDIEQLAPSKTSIMPQGLDRQLRAEELSDVIAFLQSLK